MARPPRLGTGCAPALPVSYRLLVVDDDQVIGFALSEYFSVLGYQVDSAAGVPDAAALMGGSSYDLVITDLSLRGRGGAEGLELAALVRQQHPRTRTIFLTAYGSPESEASARRLGVDAFLPKPTSLAAIAQLFEGWMRE